MRCYCKQKAEKTISSHCNRTPILNQIFCAIIQVHFSLRIPKEQKKKKSAVITFGGVQKSTSSALSFITLINENNSYQVPKTVCIYVEKEKKINAREKRKCAGKIWSIYY